MCEFVPRNDGVPRGCDFPIREIRDGKVCRPIFDDLSRAQSNGYCPVQAPGAIIVFLVMKSEAKLMTTWAALYGEILVEVYEYDLARMW